MTPIRVLIVDDNADAAESLAVLCGISGHEVRTAHDGARALAAARAFVPEVVVLDLGLPDADGCDLVPLLRRLPGMAQVRVVAVTGYAEEDVRQRSRAAGCDAHLVKPADPQVLLQLLAPVSRAAAPAAVVSSDCDC